LSTVRPLLNRTGAWLAGALAAAVLAGSPQPPVVWGAPLDEPQQLTGWQEIALEGATCGRGAPYRYFLDASDDPGARLFFILGGGGACMREGPAPAGAEGVAAQLHCMDYGNFQDPVASGLGMIGLRAAVRYVQRNDGDNPFANDSYVYVPYCTGDLHAGRRTEPYDYDPDPASSFDVVHRGHLNLAAVLEDVAARLPEAETAVLTGFSAGGFGAILNYPAVVARWPDTRLLPDAGIAPPHPLSLTAREGQRIADRWGADALLPDYCHEPACLSDTLHLLAAHAGHYDGDPGPWRPFGFLQAQQDDTLAPYLEIPACGYELALARGLRAVADRANVRAYIPATSDHVFGFRPNYQSASGVSAFAWFASVATSDDLAALPLDAVDPWLPCNPVRLPSLGPSPDDLGRGGVAARAGNSPWRAQD
jgi:hypothetical protein